MGVGGMSVIATHPERDKDRRRCPVSARNTATPSSVTRRAPEMSSDVIFGRLVASDAKVLLVTQGTPDSDKVVRVGGRDVMTFSDTSIHPVKISTESEGGNASDVRVMFLHAVRSICWQSHTNAPSNVVSVIVRARISEPRSRATDGDPSKRSERHTGVGDGSVMK